MAVWNKSLPQRKVHYTVHYSSKTIQAKYLFMMDKINMLHRALNKALHMKALTGRYDESVFRNRKTLIWHFHSLSTCTDEIFQSKINSSVRKIYILRPNRDQLRKM